MAANKNDAEAERLIGEIAERLRELAGNKGIPRRWKHLFLRATGPVAGRPGRPRNEEREIAITADYLEAGCPLNPPIFEEEARRLKSVPDEESPPRGIRLALARKYHISGKAVSRAIEHVKGTEQLLLKAQAAVIGRLLNAEEDKT